MKLLFIDLDPPRQLETALLSKGFRIETSKNLAQTIENNHDLVAFAPKNISSLKQLKEFRELHPKGWLVLAVKKAWLKDPTSLNEILKCEGINELWVLECWESMLWFSLRSQLFWEQQNSMIEKLRSENKALQTDARDLTQKTKTLLEQLERDVILAGNVQRSLLPKISPEIPGVSLSVKYIAAPGIGGDYYDIFEFGDKRRFGFLIADSKTHGMAAALLSVLVKVRLEEMKNRFPDSKSFVEFLNREIQQLHEREMSCLSLLYGILDRASLTFQYTIAGHLKPTLWRLGEAPPLPLIASPPLGGVDHYPFRENFLTLKPGDLLIFHTDGLMEPITSGTSSESQGKLMEVLKANDPSPDPLELQNELMGLVDQYVEGKQLKDDITLIQLAVDEKLLYLAS